MPHPLYIISIFWYAKHGRILRDLGSNLFIFFQVESFLFREKYTIAQNGKLEFMPHKRKKYLYILFIIISPESRTVTEVQ